MSGSLYVLHVMHVFQEITRGSDVGHLWFKFGLAASVALQAIKAYIELYEGHTRKQQIEYNNYKGATHAAILLIMFASLAFHVALWPAFGSKTLFIMFLVGYGVILQFLLLVPAWFQNLVTVVGMTFFIQQYQ